ncbi:MAG: thioredoxin family protein [Candidatus Krumholzibacteriota bacterium]|nr:thioredoxin family protein [Candidatus Krumholzibacteriota bacterium]
MMKKCQIVYPLFFVILLMQVNCSDQKNEETSAAKTKKQTTVSDTSSHLQKSSKSDSLLVTFIELGSVKCIPCRMMQPIMDEIEKEYARQVKVVFHDVWTEEGKPYARKYRIRAIPTQIFLDKDGNEYFRHEGFFPKEELVEVLKKKGVK